MEILGMPHAFWALVFSLAVAIQIDHPISAVVAQITGLYAGIAILGVTEPAFLAGVNVLHNGRCGLVVAHARTDFLPVDNLTQEMPCAECQRRRTSDESFCLYSS